MIVKFCWHISNISFQKISPLQVFRQHFTDLYMAEGPLPRHTVPTLLAIMSALKFSCHYSGILLISSLQDHVYFQATEYTDLSTPFCLLMTCSLFQWLIMVVSAPLVSGSLQKANPLTAFHHWQTIQLCKKNNNKQQS